MASPLIVTLTQENFAQQVLQSPAPVLVDFWAEWCGPCKMIAPLLDELADEYDGKVKIGKVNIDEQQILAAEYGVRAIPTLLVFQQRPGRRPDRRRAQQARLQGQPRPRRGLTPRPRAGYAASSSRPGNSPSAPNCYHQLAQLTSAGIGVIPALEQIKRNPPARSFREPLQRLLDELARARR